MTSNNNNNPNLNQTNNLIMNGNKMHMIMNGKFNNNNIPPQIQQLALQQMQNMNPNLKQYQNYQQQMPDDRDREPSDLDNTNLYIKGLWKDCTQVELDDIFKQFGVISQSRVYGDGVGFVRFEQGFEAKAAIEKMDKAKLDRCQDELLVKYAFKKHRNSKRYIREVEMIMNKNTHNVYLRCLPRGFDEQQLTALCDPYGELTCTRLRESGVAFVRFRKAQDAQNAIRALNGKRFDDHEERLLAKLANSDPFQPKIGFKADEEEDGADGISVAESTNTLTPSQPPSDIVHNQQVQTNGNNVQNMPQTVNNAAVPLHTQSQVHPARNVYGVHSQYPHHQHQAQYVPRGHVPPHYQYVPQQQQQPQLQLQPQPPPQQQQHYYPAPQQYQPPPPQQYYQRNGHVAVQQQPQQQQQQQPVQLQVQPQVYPHNYENNYNGQPQSNTVITVPPPQQQPVQNNIVPQQYVQPNPAYYPTPQQYPPPQQYYGAYPQQYIQGIPVANPNININPNAPQQQQPPQQQQQAPIVTPKPLQIIPPKPAQQQQGQIQLLSPMSMTVTTPKVSTQQQQTLRHAPVYIPSQNMNKTPQIVKNNLKPINMTLSQQQIHKLKQPQQPQPPAVFIPQAFYPNITSPNASELSFRCNTHGSEVSSIAHAVSDIIANSGISGLAPKVAASAPEKATGILSPNVNKNMYTNVPMGRISPGWHNANGPNPRVHAWQSANANYNVPVPQPLPPAVVDKVDGIDKGVKSLSIIEDKEQQSGVAEVVRDSSNPHGVPKVYANQLHEVIVGWYGEQAGKLTGMFLQNHDTEKVVKYLNRTDKLKKKIDTFAKLLSNQTLTK